MDYGIHRATREAFRDRLRELLRERDYYRTRADRYEMMLFVHHARQRDVAIDPVMMSRYLRDERPVLPTPEGCRKLAAALEIPAMDLLLQAGYVTLDDIEQWQQAQGHDACPRKAS